MQIDRLRLGLAMTLFAAMLAIGVAACGGGGSESGAGGVKVSMILPNSLEGNPYNIVHTDAANAAADKVGVDLNIVYNVPYTNQATQTTEQLFQQGADMVVDALAAGPLFSDACKKFPDRACMTFARILIRPIRNHRT